MMTKAASRVWAGLFEKYFGGHIQLGRFVLYGFNAMHVAVNFWTGRWGYVCFHPPMRCFGRWWPWYFYISPNATPGAASFAIGPGVDRWDRERSKRRRWIDVYRRMDKLRSDEFYVMRDNPEGLCDEGFARGMELAIDVFLGRIEIACSVCGQDMVVESGAAGLQCINC